jgi:polyisoprenoid-binding protein YceI
MSSDRTIDGRNVPPAGTYQIDPSHSSLELVARHLMISKVRARFATWSAEIVIAEDPSASTLSVDIDMASFSSGDAQRDGHVLSGDFFGTEEHPTATYRSTSVTPGSGSTWTVQGDLTIKRVTKPVPLEVTYGGLVTDPFGNTKALFAAEGSVERDEFGVSFNAPLEAGGVLIGNTVKLELEVQALPAS